MRKKDQDHAKQQFIDAAKSIRNIGYICVYAIGPEHGRPLKVGYAADLIARVSGIQCHNWNKIGVHTACWLKELPLAKDFERACHDRLKKRITGEWFDVSIQDVETAFDDVSRSLYVSTMRHDDMLRHIEHYRTLVKYPNLFWPNAQRLPNRPYAA